MGNKELPGGINKKREEYVYSHNVKEISMVYIYIKVTYLHEIPDERHNADGQKPICKLGEEYCVIF